MEERGRYFSTDAFFPTSITHLMFIPYYENINEHTGSTSMVISYNSPIHHLQIIVNYRTYSNNVF